MNILKLCIQCLEKLMVKKNTRINLEFFIGIFYILARERIVGWYHTGPKLHRNDISINELIREYHPDSVLVIIDAKPKDLGLPTEAYIAVEEIHDVRNEMISLFNESINVGFILFDLGWKSSFENIRTFTIRNWSRRS